MELVMRKIAFALLAAMLSGLAFADEQPIDLKKAPGLDVVEGNCAACHSLDYVQMNSPFLNAAGWDAEVSKMIKLFGAPISDEDAKKIADYLKANYGVN
jgi:sulfite dehydrogenase (cytochrome) subunit B